VAAAFAAMMLLPALAFGQEAAPPALVLELNAAQKSEQGCRLTFVVTNNLGADLSKAAFEIGLFDADGVVERLTILDFNELPAAKTRIVRFDLSGLDCTKISRALVNHATECAGDGIQPASCMRQLKTQTKTGIAFGV
jgi:hypothetical protein